MKRDHIERSPRLYLTEIIESIEKIETYTKGLTRETFLKDRLRIDGVDANLRNIGEATRVLAKHPSIKSKFYYYHIPYKMLSDLRTELTHEYFSSDPNAMWNMAVNILPNLKPQFKKILEEL
jgi:uncharacterized protein with HEPN domain